MTLAFHPLAEIFPLVVGGDFDALVEDIREHGLREPIVLLDKQIVDGRNRFRALQHLTETGEVLGDGWGHRRGEMLTPSALKPPQLWFNAYNRAADGDPLAWVISKNLKRRHLDESQRALVAAKLGRLKPHRPSESDSIESLKRETRAKMLNVGRASVARADAVIEKGVPELQRAVEQGGIAVSTAAEIAELPREKQTEVVAKGERDILAAAKEIRARQRKVRFEQVTEKLAAISEGSRPLPTGQRYPIIYADPATRYVSGFGDRSIENHYPTMTIDELCALPVADVALSNAVLFIWSTIPQLRNTMRIIEAWGFDYVSAWCWDKVDHGMGHWGFNQHEELLIATRGKFPAPVPGTQPRSLYAEKKAEHSRKPDWFAERIEAIWPTLPKIELFCRVARPGWAVWGNQVNATIVSRETKYPMAAAEDGVDGTPLSAATNSEIPGEGASGTAREASSTGCGTPAATSDVGVPAAPPHIFAPLADKCCERDTWPIGATVPLPDDFRLDRPATREADGAGATAHPDDGLSIPAFLRRDADNKFSSTGDNNASDNRCSA